MKAQTVSSVGALLAGLLQVTAAGWHDFPAFTCPQNSHDNCNPQQYGGFDWSDLPTGDFSSYGGFEFEGFSCSNTFDKRDTLSGRTFSPKCISGHASSEPENCPKAKCSDVDSFSIDILQISVEFDCDLEFHYGMGDGSTCKQKSSCSKQGTTVKNTQCGGARNVTVVLPKPPKNKPSCSVGIHSIGFNCPTKTTSVTKATTTTKPVVITTSSTTSTTSITAATTTSTTSTSAAATTSTTSPVGTSTSTTAAATSSTSTSATLASTTSPAAETSTSKSAITTSTSSTGSPYSNSSSSSSPVTLPATTTSAQGETTTVIIDTTVTTCPVTNTYTSGGVTTTQVSMTVSTITITRTSTVCTKCQAATSTSAPAPAQPTAPCPAILPSCLNTWLSIDTDCTSNDDKDCYCPNSNFTTSVFACLSAHGANDDEVAAAQAYFQGICAQYVPQNPAIVTGAPVTVTAAPVMGAVTTIDIYTTVVVPCTESNGPASTTSVISSALTVPQVIFTTMAGSSGVGLVPGTAAPAVSTAAPIYVSTTMATVAPTQTASGGNGTTTGKPAPFTGAAPRSGVAFSLVGAGLVLAFAL